MDLIFKEMLQAYEDASDCYYAACDNYSREVSKELNDLDNDCDRAEKERDDAFSAFRTECQKLAAFASFHRDVIIDALMAE